ncbi:MAG: hypothetical protein ACM3JD_13625 [Rudaea sp.]
MDTGGKVSNVLTPQKALKQFAAKYLCADIFEHYPEARILPGYLRDHFQDAEVVLDLGFGTGLWFWASFLPALKRLDGLDLRREALVEADRIFEEATVPEGLCKAHAAIGQNYSREDLQELREKRGRFFFQDYRLPWPEEIRQTRYDLVTEHGGGLADLCGEQEFVQVFQKSAEVLKARGYMLFANFRFKHPSDLPDCPSSSEHVPLDSELYSRAAEQAGMTVVDLQIAERPPEMPRVETFVYGYAQKRGR